MGWLYMKSLRGHFGPRQYLDAQFTYERPGTISNVLRSALAGMRVYYAAVEQLRIATGEREVWAAICLVRYNPRDPEGYIFGYKDMDEGMGPHECDCPAPILDLLPRPTVNMRCNGGLAAVKTPPRVAPRPRNPARARGR